MAATDSEIPREYKSGMDEVFLQGPTPPISLDMAIDSPVWQLSTGDDGRPKLIFTITSHLNHPITLRTHGTVLDTRNPYRGTFIHQRLTIKDVDTGLRICFSGSEPQLAYPPRRRLGTSDERGFTTLQPGQPFTVSYGVPCLSYNERFDGGSKGQLTFTPRAAELGGEVFSRYFEPGHRYRIGIQNRIKRRFRDQVPEREDSQVRFWWRYGLKEEVMAPPGTTPEGGGFMGWSEHEIQISRIPDVEMACEK